MRKTLLLKLTLMEVGVFLFVCFLRINFISGGDHQLMSSLCGARDSMGSITVNSTCYTLFHWVAGQFVFLQSVVFILLR